MKHLYPHIHNKNQTQPPSGGCVLKRPLVAQIGSDWFQPPSGGCVLKLGRWSLINGVRYPAAFGRLCVETITTTIIPRPDLNQPPSGGCVLKPSIGAVVIGVAAPAAFGRLCVETRNAFGRWAGRVQPPSGGCVLKQGKIGCRLRA